MPTPKDGVLNDRRCCTSSRRRRYLAAFRLLYRHGSRQSAAFRLSSTSLPKSFRALDAVRVPMRDCTIEKRHSTLSEPSARVRTHALLFLVLLTFHVDIAACRRLSTATSAWRADGSPCRAPSKTGGIARRCRRHLGISSDGCLFFLRKKVNGESHRLWVSSAQYCGDRLVVSGRRFQNVLWKETRDFLGCIVSASRD